MAAKLSEVSRVLRVDEIPLCQRLESDSKPRKVVGSTHLGARQGWNLLMSDLSQW